jgi:hypothetical protein
LLSSEITWLEKGDFGPMSRRTKLIVVFAVAAMFAGSAHAAVIDFDSLPLTAPVFFSGVFTEDGFTLDFDEYFYGPGSTSTPCCEVEREVFSDGILTITKSGGGTFTFDSVDWELEYGELATISLEGYLGAALQGIDSFSTSLLSYATFPSSVLSGVAIDRLVIKADRDSFDGGALDTLVLSERDAPEPTTLALLGLGLAGLGVARRRLH